ncbi:MAG: response regulator [Candidatus Latescibacterota bacterium]
MFTILLVEDNAQEQVLYLEELRNEGYEVILASDGRQALKKMQQGMPDLVILDIWMPGMDGIDALGYMLSEKRTMPVILYSSDPSYKSDFRSWSADAYLVKSSDLSELKQTIRSLLEKR